MKKSFLQILSLTVLLVLLSSISTKIKKTNKRSRDIVVELPTDFNKQTEPQRLNNVTPNNEATLEEMITKKRANIVAALKHEREQDLNDLKIQLERAFDKNKFFKDQIKKEQNKAKDAIEKLSDIKEELTEQQKNDLKHKIKDAKKKSEWKEEACSLLVKLDDCFLNSQCGWCGESGKCIQGNDKGPLSECEKNKFIYKADPKKWNPVHAGNINIQAKGFTLTHTPDLERIYVDSPYN